MFIRLSADSTPVVGDLDNFLELKVVADDKMVNRAGALNALGRYAAGHVWIEIQWLRDRGRSLDSTWTCGFEAMIDYARAKGWVDSDGLVRVHISADL